MGTHRAEQGKEQQKMPVVRPWTTYLLMLSEGHMADQIPVSNVHSMTAMASQRTVDSV